MKRAQLLLVLLLVATGASASQDLNVISVQHDTYRGVTCWVLNDAALSCLPDSQLQRQPDPAAEPLQNRAAPAAKEPQDGVNPASTPHPAQATRGISAMTRHINGPLGLLLVELYQALQRRDTTFGQILSLSTACGIDGRQVLANHFAAPAVNVGSLEA